MRHASLNAIARARHGVVTLDDAPRLDLTRDALSAYARRHRWQPLCDGAWLLPGVPLTFQAAALVAAWRACPRRALVGREAAAYLHGMTRTMPTTIEVVVPMTRHDAELDDLVLTIGTGLKVTHVRVIVWRSRSLKPADAAELDGIPLTTPARTVVDLAATRSLPHLRSLVIDGRQRRLVTLAEIDAVHRGIKRYPGRPKVRQVLEELDEERCDSILELRFRQAARARGFIFHSEPFPYKCSDGVVIAIDVADPVGWVAIECDGQSAHSDRSDLVKHHRRQNVAVRDGWRPFLVDWTRLEVDADRMFAELAELMATPAPHPEPAPMASPEEVDARYRARGPTRFAAAVRRI